VKEGAYAFEPNVEEAEVGDTECSAQTAGVTDAKAVAKANDLYNLFGLDAISTAATIAFVRSASNVV
jgi:aldehyde:ferredoxin oxidoreductase